MNERESNHLNLLRLVLASMVILSHSSELTTGIDPLWNLTRTLNLGGLAVCGFFVISGYLIAASWERTPTAGVFLLKRIGRICPGFWVAGLLVGVGLAPAVFGWNSYFQYVDLRRFFTLLALLQYKGPLAQLNGGYFQFNNSAWTIHLEFWCYLSTLVLGVTGMLSRKPVILGLALLVTAFHLTHWGQVTVVRLTASTYFMPQPLAFTRLWMFYLVGTCLWVFRKRVPFRQGPAVLAGAGASVLLFVPGWYEVGVAWLGGYAMMAAAYAKIPPLDRFKRMTDISYGTYLYGFPIQATLIFFYPRMTLPLHFGLSLVAAGCCGLVSWHLVEKWFVSGRHRRIAGEPIRAEAGPETE